MEMQVTTSTAGTAPDAAATWARPQDGQAPTSQQQPQGGQLASQQTGDDEEHIDPKQFREVVRDRGEKNRKLQAAEKKLAELEKREEERKLSEMSELDKAKKMLADTERKLEITNLEMERRDALIALSNARVDPAYQDILSEMWFRVKDKQTVEEFVKEQREKRPGLFAGADVSREVASAGQTQPTTQGQQQPPPASAGGPQAGGPSSSQRINLENELKQIRAKGSKHPTDVAREYQLIKQLGALKGK